MSAVIEKRGFNTDEAMQYLGVKRRFFEVEIATRCTGIPAGTSKVWERAELDAAWDKYKQSLKNQGGELQSDKIGAGSERPASGKGVIPWDAKQPESTKKRTVTKLISGTRVSDFEEAFSAVLKRRTAG